MFQINKYRRHSKAKRTRYKVNYKKLKNRFYSSYYKLTGFLSLSYNKLKKDAKNISDWAASLNVGTRLFIKSIILLIGSLLLNESIFSKINVGFLSPSQSLFDVQLGDYWVSYSNKTKTKSYNNRFTLIDVEQLNRGQLAELLNIIARYEPKVVGFDVFLEQTGSKEENKLLHDALLRQHQLVIAKRLTKSGKPIPLERTFQNVGYQAIANFIAYDSLSVIRSFPTSILKGKDIPFGAAIAERYRPQAMNSYKKRSNDSERIYYSNSLNYIQLSASQIISTSDTLALQLWLKNKIVLLGSLGLDNKANLLSDIHFTPKNPVYAGRSFPDTYGVVIHAYITNMIINELYFNEISPLLVTFIAFLWIYISLYFDELFEKKYPNNHELVFSFFSFLGLAILAIAYLFFYIKFMWVFNDDLFIKTIAFAFIFDKVIIKLVKYSLSV